MKNVLITGINGFLGRNIAKRFLGTDYMVQGLSLHNNNITDIQDRIRFYHCDLNRSNDIDALLHALVPHVVIHCAWDGGNSYAQTNESVQFDNLSAVSGLLNAMSKHSIPYFVGLGAAAEYGDKASPVSEEEYEVPVNLYGACKKMAKDYSKVFCKVKGMKWTWIRPYYTYGPGDVSTRFIPKVVDACKKGVQLRLDGCKSLTDYLYIDDFTEGVFRLVKKEEEGIFNLCSGNLYHMIDIVHLISDETGYRQTTFDRSLDRKGFPQLIGGRNTKLQERTGWIPKIGIEEGIRRTVHEHNLLH